MLTDEPLSKPKNARSKRELAKREPLAQENIKTTLFLRGTSSSSLVNSLLSDIYSLKRPFAVRFSKKNAIHPFEDASSLEFFSRKNDASLILFGSHSKKRPHCLTWIRCFGGEVLDMMELYVVQDTARTFEQFKGKTCSIGLKPLLSFSGAQFDSPSPNQYTLAKSIFLDFFRGGETQEIEVEGFQLLISFSAGENDSDGQSAKISMRCWRVVTKRSGQKLPRIEVEEMGPRIDFRIGRIKEAQDSLWKSALAKPKELKVLKLYHLKKTSSNPSFFQEKSKKNIETDIVGDKVGRIHLGVQNIGDLQTRKTKALKRGPDEGPEVIRPKKPRIT